MTAAEIKLLLIDRFTFAKGYVGAVYEVPALNAADVVAVKHGGNTQEFEIKVSRSDLIGELRCARVAAGLDDIKGYIRKQVQQNLLTDGIERTDEQIEAIYKAGHTLSRTKLNKHRFYLDAEHKQETPRMFASVGWTPPRRFVPNTFYWCISYDLLDLCRTLNKGLPYGIYVYNLPQISKYYQKFIVKSGRSLNPQGDNLYFELFNRACTLWKVERGRASALATKSNTAVENVD